MLDSPFIAEDSKQQKDKKEPSNNAKYFENGQNLLVLKETQTKKRVSAITVKNAGIYKSKQVLVHAVVLSKRLLIFNLMVGTYVPT